LDRSIKSPIKNSPAAFASTVEIEQRAVGPDARLAAEQRVSGAHSRSTSWIERESLKAFGALVRAYLLFVDLAHGSTLSATI
jgi:hypothetical protein